VRVSFFLVVAGVVKVAAGFNPRVKLVVAGVVKVVAGVVKVVAGFNPRVKQKKRQLKIWYIENID